MIIYISLDNDNTVNRLSIDRMKDSDIEVDLTEEEFNKFSSNFNGLKYFNNKIFIDEEIRNGNLVIENKKIKMLELKNLLNSTDYKIIKCYEAFMRQQPLPYNLEELSAQRDAWRAEINQLEEELKEYEV
jgi:hypothetical protein